MKKDIGIYVHIPFCKQKCFYCDFCSFAGADGRVEEYFKFLNQEIQEAGSINKSDFEQGKDDLLHVNTIYIGGGTPSYIDSKYIKQILESIYNNFDVDNNAEITIEVNPGTVTIEKLKCYIDEKINRISIGLQSTNNERLKQIGRIHNFETFLDTYNMARSVGFNNINVDFMIGLPGQTEEEVFDGINNIIKLNPEHISVYSLIIEEGTVIEKQINNGNLKLPSEEVERKMYWTVKNTLEKNGYSHYEISNFSKIGYESKHNLDCWNQKEYIGFGASAHSYTNRIRYSNIENIDEYIQNFKLGKQENNFVFHEKQYISSVQKEYMLLGLRKINGISIQSFKQKFGGNPIYIYRKELEHLVKENLLYIDGDFIKLTNKGLDLANLVWEEFI